MENDRLQQSYTRTTDYTLLTQSKGQTPHFTKEHYFDIKQIISNVNSTGAIFGNLPENSSLGSMVIKEFVLEDSGFDAVVLEDKKGAIHIAASCTDPKSYGDISTITYATGNYLFGETLAKYTLPIVLASGKISANNLEQQYLNNKDQTSQDLFNAQIKDCKNLITKYTSKSENVELCGFSLGGGIITTAYCDLKYTNPDATNNISSITVYNPFLLLAETYDNNIPNIDMIGDLNNDEKFTAFCAEGDVVSTLNNSIPKLSNRIIFVSAKDLEKSDVISLYDGIKNGEKPLERAKFTIVEFYNFLISEKGNHGMYKLDSQAFDENGNLTELGKYQNINEY